MRLDEKSKAVLLYLHFWCILLCLEHCDASTTNEMLSSYSSMRALDKFGASVQLKHAREAATRHGRLIVGAIMTTGMTECNIHQDQISDSTTRTHGLTSSLVVVSVGNRQVVRSLTLPLPSSHDDKDKNMVAMCCTGIKSDADWLIRHMQKYVANVWETYDHHPMETSALAYWLSRLLGSYQDNDLEEEWQSSIRRGLAKESSSQRHDTTIESSLARPLGLQTILFSTSSTINEPNLLRVEPTGRVFRAETTNSFAFVTIGKQSEVLKERLLRSSLDISIPVDLEQLLVEEILETLGSTRGEMVELVVERIRPETGIECTLLTCKNGKVQSRSPLSSSFVP